MAEPVVSTADLPPVASAKALVRRSFYVKEKDIAKYGDTVGCPGCIARALGGRVVAHGAECRARVEAAIVAEGDVDMRVEAARARKREGDGQAVASTSSAAVAASSAAVAASSAVVPAEPAALVAKRPKATAADAPMPARSEDDDMHAALAALGDASPDIMEVFSPGRFTERSSAFD